jgi:hypothetical protein
MHGTKSPMGAAACLLTLRFCGSAAAAAAAPVSRHTLHAQAATLRVGNYEGEEVFTPFKALLPMVDPNDFVLGGWDISGLNMAEAMERAKVRVCV